MTFLLFGRRKWIMNRLVIASLVLFEVNVRINVQFVVVLFCFFHHLLPGWELVWFLARFEVDLLWLIVLRTVLN